MTYKVFLVEDEITTREGIRDNVDWLAAGFTLCGEASDGEIALPQIEATQPDVLITDIKMPFMDGLQLCKIIREHMPWMKIIIISGYNDFQYAQTAIQLGVTEYLLKPVSVLDLQAVLAKVAVTLNQEKSEREYLKKLRSQVEDNLSLLREKFLLRLITGGESLLAAIEQSQQLGLNILSPYYQVMLFSLQPHGSAQIANYQTWQQIEQIVAGIVNTNADVLMTREGMESFVLILKGESSEQLEQESAFLAGMIAEEITSKTGCELTIGTGSVQKRLGDLHQSYVVALIQAKGSREQLDSGELKKLDHATLRQFLEKGQVEDIDDFFNHAIRPLAEAALRSNLLKQYVFLDLVLAVSQFVSDMGGNTAQLIPAAHQPDDVLKHLHTLDHIQAETKQLFTQAIAFRDGLQNSNRATILQQARRYIANHFSDSNLSLNEVAAQVNFSPNHFSAVFSEETGETFRDYLTRMRIEQAKKLLQTTRLKCAEVGFQCGYNDSHYFSVIFRKNCGMTPQQYRAAARK